ncbi:MAG: HAMP domain-containing histidine kinase [Prevotellaceae bacterium]|jgi:signal transduction histidine kinase|nr:HAMP domain-containing histidine kinase [Prevotellaceae bacterium]
MKLINFLILRITLFFTVVMLFWSAIYFLLQMNEIHDGNDEGLTNLKQEFIAKANTVPGFVENLTNNAPLNLIIKEITQQEAEIIIENFTSTKVYFATELEKEEVRMLATAFRCEQNGRYYQLQCFTSTVESDDLIKNMLYLLLGLWAALGLTLVFVGKIVIAKANRPFYHLLDELKKFRLNSSRMIDLPATKIEEYMQLNKSVQHLLENNINIFTEQKQFIENTSHELQTPLAAVIAKIDVLIEKHQNNREYVEEIASILSILKRMKRLNNALLLLSKIKNRQFTETSTVDLRRMMNVVIDDFKEFAAYKQIIVETEGDATPATPLNVQMNEDLAHILFTNLVKNAIAHNYRNGKIVVRHAHNSIAIANSGQEAATNVFDRYQSRTSSGLGLSIVKSIVDMYGINISYKFENGMHVFEIVIND